MLRAGEVGVASTASARSDQFAPLTIEFAVAVEFRLHVSYRCRRRFSAFSSGALAVAAEGFVVGARELMTGIRLSGCCWVGGVGSAFFARRFRLRHGIGQGSGTPNASSSWR